MAKREMLINCVPDEECRIAITEGNKLEEIYQERASAESHVGNIYKGRVVNVEPSIQAVFIRFGLERNGFLHITDLHPKYFPSQIREDSEQVGRKTPRHDRPPIQNCLRRGQEITVQIIKEGVGTKGPTLTSYLSIPGRFLVMMPDMERLGVSRKVEDEDTRREMRKLIAQLDPPKGFGFIVRTASSGQTKTELKRDLAYLLRLWSVIDKRQQETPDVGELYAETDLVIRTIRDVYTSDIERVIVDDLAAAKRARGFLGIANPRSASKVLLYKGAVPLFRQFGIEKQIDSINQRTVELPSGGSLVIDSTEAVVTIDVNSGKMRNNRDAETTAYKANLEAADEICRQLRLRDLGGVIINDLIDMVQAKHRQDIEQLFRKNLKNDRARTRIAAISPFGILEMTRQRMRPSLQKSTFTDCPQCKGNGSVKSTESVVLEVMRQLASAMHDTNVDHVDLTISPDVAFQLLNRKRSNLVDIEKQYGKSVMVRVNGQKPIDYIELAAYDVRGGTVDTDISAQTGTPQLEVVENVDLEKIFEHHDETAGEDNTASDAPETTASATVKTTGDENTDPPVKKSKTRRSRRGGRRVRRKRENQSSAQAAMQQKPEIATGDKPKPKDSSPASSSNQDKKPSITTVAPKDQKNRGYTNTAESS